MTYPLRISCTKATELIEKRVIAGLTFSEQVKLRLHVAVCAACRAYEAQSALIDHLLDQDPDELPSTPGASSTLSKKILKNLPK